MIYRNVLFKLNDRADDAVMETVQGFVSRIRDEIEETRFYHFAPNDAARDGDFNWVLLAGFDNEDAMNAYRVDPLHEEFVAYCEPYTDDALVCFYRVPVPS